MRKAKDIIYESRNIIIIILAFLTARIFFLTTRYHLPGWDESVYIGMGKYIYSGGTMGLWESIRAINLPLITGFFWKMGLDPVLYSEIVMIAFACASIFLTYILAKRMFNMKTAVFASIIVACSPLFFYHTGLIMTEIPALFFILLTVYLYIEKRYFWAGLCAGVATLFRFPAGLIFLILGLDMIIHKLKEYREGILDVVQIKQSIFNLGLYIMSFTLLIFSFLISNYYRYRQFTANAFDAMLRPFLLGSIHQNNIFESVGTTSFWGKVYNIFYYLIALMDDNLLFIFFILGIIFILKQSSQDAKKNLPKRHFASVQDNHRYNPRLLWLIVIFYLAYLTYIINKQPRFLILIIPFIAILTSWGILTLYSKLSLKKNVNARRAFVILCMLAITYASLEGLHYYTWQTPLKEPPKIANEYYTFFEDTGIRGTILTTDPVFASYSDNRFIAYYDTASNIKYLNPWEMDDPIVAIVYTNYSIPCIPGDDICIENREILLDNLMDNNDLIYNYSNDFAERYIFWHR